MALGKRSGWRKVEGEKASWRGNRNNLKFSIAHAIDPYLRPFRIREKRASVAGRPPLANRRRFAARGRFPFALKQDCREIAGRFLFSCPARIERRILPKPRSLSLMVCLVIRGRKLRFFPIQQKMLAHFRLLGWFRHCRARRQCTMRSSRFVSKSAALRHGARWLSSSWGFSDLRPFMGIFPCG